MQKRVAEVSGNYLSQEPWCLLSLQPRFCNAAASSSKGEGASRNIYSNVNPRKGWPYAAIYLKLVKKSEREEAGDDEKD